MAIIRLCALLAVGVMASYHVLRSTAVQCSGPHCDNYIAAVLLLPLALILAALTGLLVIAAARQQGQRSWLVLLTGCTMLGVVGAPVSLFFLRNSPDAFVAVFSALVLLVPLIALIYSFVAPSPVARGAQ